MRIRFKLDSFSSDTAIRRQILPNTSDPVDAQVVVTRLRFSALPSDGPENWKHPIATLEIETGDPDGLADLDMAAAVFTMDLRTPVKPSAGGSATIARGAGGFGSGGGSASGGQTPS